MQELLNCDLLTTQEAAVFLNVPKATLETWRCTKAVRLPFVRLGRSVRYRRSDLERWLSENTIDAEAVGVNHAN